MNDDKAACDHRYLTSHGHGWMCSNCGTPVLSLMLPIPLPVIAQALKVIGAAETECALIPPGCKPT